MTSERVCYLYAVVATDDAPPTFRVGRGVDGAEVTTVAQGPLTALISEVPASRYGEPALTSHVEDLDWLTDTARAHHRVVEALARVTAVAPLRMGTVASDAAAVRDLLTTNRDRFGRVLERVRGRLEWGAKAYLIDTPVDTPTGSPTDTGTDTRTDPPTDTVGTGASGPGTAYLLRKRGQRDRARRALARATERAQRLHELLASHAVAAKTYPPQDPKLAGRPEPMVLNATYLVADSAADRLRAAAASFEADDLRVELTGPWAPYSFTEDSSS